jgi:hypothetical protein
MAASLYRSGLSRLPKEAFAHVPFFGLREEA